MIAGRYRAIVPRRPSFARSVPVVVIEGFRFLHWLLFVADCLPFLLLSMRLVTNVCSGVLVNTGLSDAFHRRQTGQFLYHFKSFPMINERSPTISSSL